MASIASLLERLKQDLKPFLPDSMILNTCIKAGHRWRRRQLGPVQTIHLFILQILNFNTAMTALWHLAKEPIKASAYCRARMRLPLEVLEALLVQSSTVMRQAANVTAPLWCGLTPYLVDGSSTITPDTPSSQKAFGHPTGQKKGCGFPVPKILGLFDAFSGLIVQMLVFPLYTHEQSKVWMLHPMLKGTNLLVGDRGFCSLVHLAMLQVRGIHGLFRAHQRTIMDFRPRRRKRRNGQKGRPSSRFIKRLGKWDQIVEYSRTKRPQWMSQAQYATLPDTLLLRELKFTIKRKGQRTVCVTLVTTLLDPVLYPKRDILELYGVRWQVETHFGQLKTTLKMRKVKSKTAQGVRKELVVYALVYNLIHVVMLQAALRENTTPDRIGFLDTLRWLLSAAPGECLPDLLVNPFRPDRHEPRVIKDLQDTYRKMTRPRKQLRKELKTQMLAA